MLKFLRPSALKIAVPLVLFISLTWLWGFIGNMFIMDASFYGVPLKFFTAWGPCQIGQDCSDFNGINLLLDLVFWYLVCAFVIERFNKKKQ